MRILVCGGRKYMDWRRVNTVLDELHAAHGIEMVIHGGAGGADEFGHGWAVQHSVKPKRYPAQWHDLSHPDAVIKRGKGNKDYDAKAGSRRNQQMLDEEERIDLVVAFPGGPGTRDMCRRALAKGLKVMKVEP